MPATLTADLPTGTPPPIFDPTLPRDGVEPSAALHPAHRSRPLLVWTMVALFALGVFLRVFPSSGFPVIGFDERLYANYLSQLDQVGALGYPDVVENYLERQAKADTAMLPPTRAGFLLPAWAWHRVTGTSTLGSVRAISALASCLALGVGAAFAGRLGGRGWAVATLALMACAPLQIHLAQRALVDGYFAFWAVLALWALWECLQRTPETLTSGPFLWTYGGALVVMVLTKENAAFVFASLVGLLALAPWGRFGLARPGRTLWLMTFVAPTVAMAILIILCGGADRFVGALRLNVQKSLTLLYALRTGDGPWHRYLLDLVTLSPATVMLAVGGMFQARRGGRGAALLFLTGFVVLTYAAMCQVRYGMNLRYGAIWDLPLRLLALGALVSVCEVGKARRDLLFAVGVVILGGLDLWAYHRFFVIGAIYDPVPAEMLRVLDILKN